MNEYQKEQEALAKEAPVLFTLKGKSPFKLPVGYLEKLQAEVLSSCLPDAGTLKTPAGYHDDLRDRLLELSGESAEEPKGFKMPEGYLKDLQQSIAEQTINSEQPTVPQKGKVIRMAGWIATAAAACLVILLVINPFKQAECQSFTCMLEKVELSSDDYLELYDEEIIQDLLPGEASLLEGIDSDDEMIDYLLDEEVDLIDLYELDEI